MRTSSYTVDVLVDKTPTTFTIPKNSRIDSIVVEKRGTAAGNISVGTTTTGPTYETILLDNITEANGAGTISISLREGTATEIPIVGDETAEEVAQAIATASYEGYTAELKGTVGVLFTATTSGVKTEDNTISFGSTGIVGNEPTVTREGSDAVFEQNTVTVTAAATSSGDITVDGVTVAVLDTDSVSDIAGKIAAATYTGWTAVQGTGDDDHIVTFTATEAGAKEDLVFLPGGTLATADVAESVAYAAAVSEQVTLPAPTSGAIADGFVTITLDTGVYSIPVSAGDDVATITAAILAADYDGWTAADVGGDTVFTADVAGALEVTPDVSYGTEVTADEFSVTAGTGWAVGEEIVAETALSTEHASLRELTVVQSVFEKDTNKIVAAGITEGAKAILHVLLERYL